MPHGNIELRDRHRCAPHRRHSHWRPLCAAIFGALLPSMLLQGCSRLDSARESPVISMPDQADLSTVSGMRVLFAHQSVGNDILDGVRSITHTSGIEMNIAESRQPADTGPGIFHFRVGRNGAPDEKIADFDRVIASGAARQMNAVMLKLCYIDFNAPLDAEALARRYVGTLRTLQQQHPEVAFVAVTAPVTTLQTGPKAWVKKLLGRPPSGLVENQRRLQFNRYLRSELPKNALFDLAHLESSGSPAGSADTAVEAMNPALTVDGGHLNERGKTLVSSEFIRFLAHVRRAPG